MHPYSPNYSFINIIPLLCLFLLILGLGLPLRSSNTHCITFVLTSLNYHLIIITSPNSHFFDRMLAPHNTEIKPGTVLC